jgi:hypothetical protein
MSKARLIKRREWLEREQIAQRQARLSPVAKVEVDAVRNWWSANKRLIGQMPARCLPRCLRRRQQVTSNRSNLEERLLKCFAGWRLRQ